MPTSVLTMKKFFHSGVQEPKERVTKVVVELFDTFLTDIIRVFCHSKIW